MLLKEIPIWDRPREKAVRDGVENLSTVELLAILLNTGTKDKSVIMLAQELINQLETLSDLSEISAIELKKIKGVGDTKAIRILASIEFARRVLTKKNNRQRLLNNDEVYEYLKLEVQTLKQENVIALYLDVKGNLLAKRYITKGTKNQTIMDVTEILKWALKLSAAAFIVVHNHPSGHLEPSKNDLDATFRLKQQATGLGIIMLDHLIIGNGYYSLFTDKKKS